MTGLGAAQGVPSVRGGIDLHMHSTASDGILAPEKVVAAASAAGLSAIALTDHDTVAGVAEAVVTGEVLGIRVIHGVELSAEGEGEGAKGDNEVHVLGLHLTRLDGLEEDLVRLRGKRLERAKAIVERLNALGVAIQLTDVLAESEGGAVGRPHVARALIKAGAVRDQREAFDRYLGRGRPAFVPKDPLSVGDATAMIHDAGGLAIWAHPGQGGRRERVERLVAAGLDGLEVRHPSHSSDDRARLESLCDFFELAPSGGSDWHGHSHTDRALGSQAVPTEWLERQERALARRAAAPAAQAR